jgi:hypothetical protein
MYNENKVSIFSVINLPSCGLLVIMFAIGPKVHGFKPNQRQWIFKGDKNSLHDFLQRGSKAISPMT